LFNIKENTLNWILFFILFIWCLGILGELLIHIFPSTVILFPLLKYNYSIVCHQQNDKLFHYFGYTTLVCSRCTGIYFGGLLSIILILFNFKKELSTKILLIVSIPLFFDVIFVSVGIYEYSHYLALVTGLLLGSFGFFYIHKSIVSLFTKNKG
jgi:uncharacterized membrane protein